MPTNATGQASDSFKEFVEKVWEKTGKSKEEFLSLFSVESGNFEQRALYSHLAELSDIIEESEWSEQEKRAAAQALTRAAFAYQSDDDFELAELAFSEADLYRPANMPHVIFPRKSFNVIGARTSRGKTTFAVSLALDALERTDRQCVFLTLEETWEQIRARIYNAFLFAEARQTGDYTAVNTKRPQAQLAGFFRHPDTCRNYAKIRRVRERIRAYEQEGRLQVYDMGRRAIGDIELVCNAYGGAIVIIDYVTKIRASADYAQSRLDGFNDIADRLEELAKSSDLTIIAGAQLRRSDGRIAADSDTPDVLNDTMLKECGKFEEVANTIVFLGRNTAQSENLGIPGHDMGEPVYFWKIIKNRGGRGVNQSYLFDTTAGSMGYSYMKSLAEPCRADRLSNKGGCRLKDEAEPCDSASDDDLDNAEKKPPKAAGFLNSDLF